MLEPEHSHMVIFESNTDRIANRPYARCTINVHPLDKALGRYEFNSADQIMLKLFEKGHQPIMELVEQ